MDAWRAMARVGTGLTVPRCRLAAAGADKTARPIADEAARKRFPDAKRVGGRRAPGPMMAPA